ncbi:MAG: NOL1/NOP2/sun family putative RNA methylase [Candidatus Woesearchaeota archaeon]
MELKKDFEERYQELLKDKYEEFKEYSSKYITKAIRVNTLKISVEDLKKRLEDRWNLIPVPWCKEGFWITYKDGDRFDIGNLPEHQLGYIYVQDPASMIPPVVLNPKPHDIVLDMCSAPGSKTTQLAMYMDNKGMLIANDESGKRLSALGLNLTRCGVSNTIINHMRGEQVKGEYDKISVDAPCSGTGTIRRNFKIAEMYSFGLVKRMQSIQKKLIRKAYQLLKKGGILVYSTCTLEPEENEEVIDYLLKEFEDAEVLDIELNINRQPAILEFENKKYDPRVSKCLRILPQDNDTEGFFVCKIQKK